MKSTDIFKPGEMYVIPNSKIVNRTKFFIRKSVKRYLLILQCVQVDTPYYRERSFQVILGSPLTGIMPGNIITLNRDGNEIKKMITFEEWSKNLDEKEKESYKTT